MVIVIDGEVPSTLNSLPELYQKYPNLLENARQLSSTKAKLVKPEGVLYARQKEFVVTHQGDQFPNGNRVTVCGTEDVLTCHVIILHHPFTRVVALAHFDEFFKEEGVMSQFLDTFLQRVTEKYYSYDDVSRGEENVDNDWEWEDCSEDGDEFDDFEDPIHLHLIGGYDDEAGKAQRLSLRILRFFHDQGLQYFEPPMKHVFHLKTCCLGQPNTRMGRYFCHTEPIITGVGFDVNKSTVFNASFNRSFVSSVDDDIIKTLMLGPSLIRTPAKLKKIILQMEDKGYQSAEGIPPTARSLV